MDNPPHNTLAVSSQKVKNVYRSLSPERVLITWGLVTLSALLLLSAAIVFNRNFLISVPTYGGTLHEGILGTPRFINPVLAITDQDKDLSSLLFSGLVKIDAENRPVLDMAESIEKSSDLLTYTVHLKDSATFHDGTKVTSDDIIYTVGLIQNPSIKSPHKIEWEGVTVEKIDENQLFFTLKKPYPYFMEILSIGILPKHVWKNLTDEQISLSDFNIHAIGSGPYKLIDIDSKSGIPITFYLKAHKHYTLGRPYIENMIVHTYQNEKLLLQAIEDKDVTRIHGISPDKLASLPIASGTIQTTLLPRTFTIFFNPNKATLLSEKEIRQALLAAIDKKAIVDDVLLGYGKVINDPFQFDDDQGTSTYDFAKAKALYEDSKAYAKSSSTQSLSLATANTDEMKRVANMIKSNWELLGIKTTLSVYEVSDLNQSVIKDRDFDVLLYGTITQNPADLYAFWHSSQRNYPGLNISNYVSKDLDKSLELLRTSDSEEERLEAYRSVEQEFIDEIPGIFLFAPDLIYITNDKVNSRLPKNSTDISSRLSLVTSWYRYSEHVWPRSHNAKLKEFVQNLLH